MYNYKPQKDDEVELRKGDYYTVTEKCQDGWFKGQCLKSGNVGVYPGNYVQMIRYFRISATSPHRYSHSLKRKTSMNRNEDIAIV